MIFFVGRATSSNIRSRHGGGDSLRLSTSPRSACRKTVWPRYAGSVDHIPSSGLAGASSRIPVGARVSASVVQGPGFIAQDPLSERLLVAEYEGRIYSFLPNDPAGKKDLFLDMGRGISAFSFHPKYKENGYVYVFSHADMKISSRSSRRAVFPDINWSQGAIRRGCVRVGNYHHRVAFRGSQRR